MVVRLMLGGLLLLGALWAMPVRAQVTIGCPNSDCGWSRPAAPPKPEAKRFLLAWKSHATMEGFQNATIDLVYTFIRCADEIQVAYSIDRASFRASRSYILPTKGQYHPTMLDLDPPPAPPSIWLYATVEFNDYPQRFIGRIEDRFAGESLGMGCFDGQTQKLGTVAELVGADATPAKIKAFLAALVIRDPIIKDGPLTRAGIARTAAAEEERRKTEEEQRAAAELAARDAAALKAANEAVAARAKAETARIEAAKAEFARQQAEYTRGVAAATAAKAQYERDKAANEADVARYRQQRATYEAGELAAGRVPKP